MTLGFMIIFGKNERTNWFEGAEKAMRLKCRGAYDEAQAYHDGKWIMSPIS